MNTRAREATRCPACGGSLMTISLRMAEGEAIYRICPPCEANWWERDGTRVARDEVLSQPTER
ncbi:MAG: hypothetical protein ACRDI0_09415 [Actinomycetota bacterium]